MNSASSSLVMKENTRWTAPEKGWLKLNVDASEYIVRNRNGNPR